MASLRRCLLPVLLVVTLAVAVTLHGAAALRSEDDVLVKTPLGVARGLVGTGFFSFRGLPYAEPPVGTLRWRAPVPKASWGPDVLDASAFGHCCMQPGDWSDISEDCLTLNVFTPQNATFGGTGAQLLPVILFIHGGAFVNGCSRERVFTSDFVVNSTNTILVTTNYRLGALGTFANDISQGNFGLLDQIAAMEWVKANIAYFGGDPNRVTISGESAGAMSVGMHLASPVSIQRDLFQAAILESDPFSFQSPSLNEAKEYATFLGAYLACPENDMACLLSKSAEEVIAAQSKVLVVPWPPKLAINALPWMPFVDGTVIADQALSRYAAGKFHRVPVLVGTNQNETLTFAMDITSPLHNQIYDWEYESLMYVLFGEHASEVLKLYPPTYTGQDFSTLVRMTTDFLFVCSTRNAALSLSSYGVPVFTYHFLRSAPPHTDPANPPYCSVNNSVCHASELVYVFHSASFFANEGYAFSPADSQLSWEMLRYWTTFAHTQPGRNNNATGPSALWTPFSSSNLASMAFNVPQSSLTQGFNKLNCNYWDSIGYHF